MTPGPTIVDASVAVKWVVTEARSDRAATLLDGRALHAPSLMLTEAANALWVMARRGAIAPEASRTCMDLLADAPVLWERDAPDVVGLAHALALDLDHPIYDCLYLAHAIRLDATIITDDGRFLKAVRGTHAGRMVALEALVVE